MALIPKIRFPVPSSGRGEEFGSPEELLSVLAGESSGLYLVGSQGMWHGGIHITDATVPWCALTGQNASEQAYVSKPYPGEQAVRCMADGKIVAYRICEDYDAIEWRSDRLFFSTSFVLAEHYVQPGEQASSGLKFYTLYMNLAPVSAYRQPDAGLRKTAKVLNYYRSPDDVNAARASGTLPAGTRLKLGNQVMTSAHHHRQFSEVSVVNDTDLLKAGDIIWTASDQGWLKPLTGEEKIPSWWKKCSLASLSGTNNGQLYKTSVGLNMYFSAEDIRAGKECDVLPKHFPVTTDSSIPVFTRPKDQRVFSLVTLGRDYNKLKKGDRVWLVSDHDNLTAVTVQPAGTGKYDEVVVPATAITINAGDSIGHLGFFELPQENGKRSRYQVHIECLSADSHLPAFLSNPDKVDEDNPVYLSYAEGAELYMPDGQGKMVSAARKSQLSGILTRSKVKGADADGKILSDNLSAAYYQVPPENGWMAASDVKKVAQYDLAALGFMTLDKMPESFDLIDGIHHPDNVVKGILEALYQVAKNETDSSRMLNQYNYQRLLQNIDNNNDGQYSEQEYLQAIHNISYRDHLYRLIVKHPSEWYYGKDDAYWKPYLDTLTQDTALAAWKNYTESFISKMAWMKQVPGMVAEPWHMHPVTFLTTLPQKRNKEIIFPLKMKPKNDIEGEWRKYYWAASLTGGNASQAIFGVNRAGGKRKHAARDLYTEPSTEIVAICNGVVRTISNYYMETWQITVEHMTNDGRHFYIRYGEVDFNTIVVKIGEKVTQGQELARTGLLLNPQKKHLTVIPGQIVYMLHFEYYPGSNTTPPPNNTSVAPFHRREDLQDPLELLKEAYNNTFDIPRTDAGDRFPIENLNVSDKGKDFIKAWEHFEPNAYNDSENFCTIGFGHLIARTKCEDITLPAEFKNGITKEKANELFELRLADFISELKRNVSVNLYQYEFDALISLLFNLGRMSKAPQLNAKLNKADYQGASAEFLDITNGGNKGLVNRRKKEQNLFLNNIYDSSH